MKCYHLPMFRKAEADDIEAVCRLYDSVHSAEESGLLTIGWKRGVYPTDETVRKAFAAGELFVGYDDGILVAAGVINQRQVDAYAGAPWSEDVPDSGVMVLHTLAVLPSASRRGFSGAWNAPLPTVIRLCRSFGDALSPAELSAPNYSTSELLRTL